MVSLQTQAFSLLFEKTKMNEAKMIKWSAAEICLQIDYTTGDAPDVKIFPVACSYPVANTPSSTVLSLSLFLGNVINCDHGNEPLYLSYGSLYNPKQQFDAYQRFWL